MKNMRKLQEMEQEARAALLGVSCTDAVLCLYVPPKVAAREILFCPAEAERRAGRAFEPKKECGSLQRDCRICEACRLRWLMADREKLLKKRQKESRADTPGKRDKKGK